jgi:hypothetical protein
VNIEVNRSLYAVLLEMAKEQDTTVKGLIIQTLRAKAHTYKERKNAQESIRTE